MSKPARCLLGLDFEGRPLFEPKSAHKLLLAAAGGWKTTAGAVPWLLSLLCDGSRAIVINDCKDGEIAAQCAHLCAAYGRNVATIDDFGVLGADNPYRISLNPFGSVTDAFEKKNGELIFASENATHALIEEPPKDQRNAYWRDEPRTLNEFSLSALLARNPRLATPGSVWKMIADPQVLQAAAKNEAIEGDEALQALARHVLGMHKNQEHFPQHRSAALKSLRIFGAGSALHFAGADADLTHRELIEEKYIVFVVGPVRHMERLGSYYALHLQSFCDALLSGESGAVDFILDEFTNAPLKALVSRLTTMRGYGGRCHMIAQSRSEIQRKYGEKETSTIEENAILKQWFGFSSFEEAERVSRAMGEAQNVSHTMGVSSDRPEFSGNFQTGKERLFTPDELMQLRRMSRSSTSRMWGLSTPGKSVKTKSPPIAMSLAIILSKAADLRPIQRRLCPLPKRGAKNHDPSFLARALFCLDHRAARRLADLFQLRRAAFYLEL